MAKFHDPFEWWLPAKELNIPPHFWHPADADKADGLKTSFYADGATFTYKDNSQVKVIDGFWKRIK